MKYLLCFILLLLSFGMLGGQLYYAHTLTTAPVLSAMACFGFALFLLDPTNFLAYCAEVRKNATAWLTKGTP